jgi:hypothetical protein
VSNKTKFSSLHPSNNREVCVNKALFFSLPYLSGTSTGSSLGALVATGYDFFNSVMLKGRPTTIAPSTIVRFRPLNPSFQLSMLENFEVGTCANKVWVTGLGG